MREFHELSLNLISIFYNYFTTFAFKIGDVKRDVKPIEPKIQDGRHQPHGIYVHIILNLQTRQMKDVIVINKTVP